MSTILVLVSLCTAGSTQDGFASASAAAKALSAEMRTGTLLVSNGDCLAVRIYSQSPHTHVAAVVVRHGQPFVYDSAKGAGTRCQTLANYLKSQRPDEVHVFQPRRPFSEKRAAKFESYLDQQLGRPYAIRHHLTGKRSAGVHCAEYVTDALMACKVIHAKQPARVSPASLVQGILKAELYEPGRTIRFNGRSAKAREADGWCSKLWLDTKQCTSDCWAQTKRWFFCR